MTHDLYAHAWDKNCDINPFDIAPSDQEQDDIQEYVPIDHPPTLESSKNSGGAPVEQTTFPPVLMKKPKMQKMKVMQMIINKNYVLPLILM